MKLFSGQDRRKSMRFAVLGVTLISLAALIIIVNPLKLIVDDQLSLRQGSILFNLWQKPPLEVYIKVYVFNITNYDRFSKGLDKKVKLDEVGPYVYQEFLENHNATFNYEDNTVTFAPRRYAKFVPELSVGDPKVDTLTVPNLPYMGVTTAVSQFSLFGAMAVRALMRTLKSEVVIKNISVHDYFWGYDDPLVTLASRFIPSVIHFQTFGLLDRMFDEGENTVTMNLPHKKNYDDINGPISERLVSTTAEYKEHDNSINTIINALKSIMPDEQRYGPYEPNIRDFSIDSYNGERGLKSWGYVDGKYTGNTECNTLSGTYDGTLFPRNISKGETFRIYRKTFCRTLRIEYSHPGVFDGVDAYYFKLADNAFDSNIDDPTSSCFCRKNVCLKKGLGNITPCYYNIPAAVSFPHFFNADPSLVEGVEGLSPDEKKHGSEIILQPQLGIPMRVHSRLQLNLLMGDIKFNADMRPFENTVLPIVWFEVSVDKLTTGLLFLLHMLFGVLPYAQITIIVILIAGGIALLSLSALWIVWFPKRLKKFHDKTLEIKRFPSNMFIVPLMKSSNSDDLSAREGDEERLATGPECNCESEYVRTSDDY